MPNANVQLPGCKSTSQRALICAALGDSLCVLKGVSQADDSLQLIAALRELGVEISDGSSTGEYLVTGTGGELPVTKATLDCGRGATTLRFLMAICALHPGEFTLHADSQLRRRPQQPLVDSLTAAGASILKIEDGWLVHGCTSLPTEFGVDCRFSSQYASALLLATQGRSEVEVRTHDLVSSAYFDLTKRVIREFSELPEIYVIPSDLSAAMFFAAAALIQGKKIGFTQPLNWQHPEVYALNWMQQHCGLKIENDCFSVEANFEIPVNRVDYDLSQAVDSSLAVAALSRFLNLQVNFNQSNLLQAKESDRWLAINELMTTNDRINCADDHRVAMAGACLKLFVPRLELCQFNCVSKSFPDFLQQWHLIN